MKKTELVTSITSFTFCKGIVTQEQLINTNEAGDKFYKVNIRLIKDNVIEYRDVQYVVLSEGTDNEEAYFLNEVPTEASMTVAKQLVSESAIASIK